MHRHAGERISVSRSNDKFAIPKFNRKYIPWGMVSV